MLSTDTLIPPTSSSEAILSDLARVAEPIWDLLNDADVVEISVNSSGKVFVTRFGTRPEYHGDFDPVDATIFTRWCAAGLDLSLNEENPIVSGRLPGTRHRIEIVVPPVTEAPSFSIRRHSEVIRPLTSFGLTDAAIDVLRRAVVDRANIIVSGGTGCGKTTFQSALLAELHRELPDTRLVILEDTRELQTRFANVEALLASPTMSLDRLLVTTLRLAPDRIVVGEVRTGAVALTLLKAWNTGHRGGLSTIHANSALEVFARIDALIAEVSLNTQSKLVAETVDMVVQLGRETGRPAVKEIIDFRHNKKGDIVYDA